jgi:cytidylate kinase
MVKFDPTQILRLIAIDGPAASGKSSVARSVASRLGWNHIDSGSIYRTVRFVVIKWTLELLKKKIPFESEEALDWMRNNRITFEPNCKLNGCDVTEEIRSPIVSQQVSLLASITKVRTMVVELQRSLATKGNVVMEGRDTGAVVVPNAALKVFITADIKERARRRHVQIPTVSFIETIKEIEMRDYRDTHRSVSPLVKAKDAILMDSTFKTQKQVEDDIIQLANKLFCL